MAKRKHRKIPQQTFTASISHLSHDGRGIAHLNGKTTFISQALPNETVEFKYTKLHSQFDEGQATSVKHPSPDRITPKCPHFAICGGCSLQHIKPDAQIGIKQQAVLELLKSSANITVNNILPPLTADVWHYRHKARLGSKFLAKKNKVLVGFREKNGRFITDLTSCDVLHASVGQHIHCISKQLYQLDNREHIPQIEIAVADGHTAIIVRHLKPLSPKDTLQLIQLAQTHQYRLYLQPKGTDSIHCIWPTVTDELMSYTLPEYQLKLAFHPAQFIQVNSTINQKMIAQAIYLLDISEKDHVLDLFCGIGNFTLPIAQRCHAIVGVEGDTSAIKLANLNANNNLIANAQFYASNLFENCSEQRWARAKYDKILLDPPRSGAKEILLQCKQWQPSRIVYVSCNPATFARDAKILVTQGYKMDCIGVMDMFPHTQHVETMALYTR